MIQKSFCSRNSSVSLCTYFSSLLVKPSHELHNHVELSKLIHSEHINFVQFSHNPVIVCRLNVESSMLLVTNFNGYNFWKIFLLMIWALLIWTSLKTNYHFIERSCCQSVSAKKLKKTESWATQMCLAHSSVGKNWYSNLEFMLFLRTSVKFALYEKLSRSRLQKTNRRRLYVCIRILDYYKTSG